MFDVESYVKDWFTRNGMSPLFALSEFCRLHKVEARVKNKEVIFIDEREHTDIGRLIDGSVFEIGTWKMLRNQNVTSSTILTESQPKTTGK